MSDLQRPSSGSATFLPGHGKLPFKSLKQVRVDERTFLQRSAFDAVDAVIMMVDDEQLNIEMTQAFLEDAGYRNFVSTHESEDAVELMREKRPNVLLLDLSMPKVSGMDILEVLRNDEQLRHTPVIVLTSNSDAPTKIQALALGAMDFLPKPVDPSELGLRLRNTLAATAHRDWLANHDALTGLRNRARYLDEVEAAVASAVERKYGMAVVHIGADRMSQVNDALGRPAGDALLQRMGKRIRQCVESQGGELGEMESQLPSVYRFDGDEFAVLVPFVPEMESIAGLITTLLEAAGVSIRAGERELMATASMGVAVFPTDARNASDLIANAGVAMRKAKQSGRNTYEFFSRDMHTRALEKLNIGGDLRRAIAREELSLKYQPRIDVTSGRLMGCEAVLNWTLASGAVLEGNKVLTLADTSEMSILLSEWTMDQVAAQVRVWQKAGLSMVPVGMDISLRNMPLSQLVEVVMAALKTGAPADLMCLELNTPSALEDVQVLSRAMHKLKVMGLRLALDHFGTNESGLANLHALLPYDEIKIDASLMFKIEENKVNQAVMQSVLALGKSLGVPIVATGIHTLAQLAFLKNHNADQCQGKLFNLPMPAQEFAAKWLARS
jgi:diguanylate cyclase (GGDEF)-like protein